MKIEEYVEAFKSGDEEAFNFLVKQYEKLVFYIAFQYVKNEADAYDIAQETFIEIHKSIQALHEPKYFKAWLSRIAFSKVSHHFRKQKENTMNEEQYANMNQLRETRRYLLPEQNMDYTSNQELLMSCLNTLKPMYHTVIFLCYFEQLSMSEISFALEIPIGTVKTRLRNGKKELKKEILKLQKEQDVQFFFRSHTIATLLTSCALTSYEKAKYVPLHSNKIRNILYKAKVSAISNPLMAVTLSGIVITTTTFVGYTFSENRSVKQNLLPVIVASSTQYDSFPTLQYEDQIIHNAYEAYSILFTYAHCEREWETQNEVQKSSLLSIYNNLISYGGDYRIMAESANFINIMQNK